MKLGITALVLLALTTLAGCPSVVGRSCDTSENCGAGFVCISELVPGARTPHRFCARACAHDAECGGGIECVYGFCSEFGSLPEGASCNSQRWECGPGLVCDGFCVPGCNLRSPYRSDRACPSGLICLPDQVACTPPPCDPTLPDQCLTHNFTDGMGHALHPICRRWTNPGGEDGTVCMAAEAYVYCASGTMCPLGQVCDSDRCFTAADAPPIAPDRWFPPLTAPVD